MQPLKYTSFFIFFLASFFLYAQNDELDKLKEEIQTQPNDSLKVNSLITLSNQYLGTDLVQATRYGNEALDLAKSIDFERGIAYAYKAIALSYYFQANYPEAAIQFQNSLAVFTDLNDKVGIANILSNLGSTYFNAGDDTKAIDFYLRSLKISEEVNDRLRIGTALNGVGSVYNNNPSSVDKALEYFMRALPIFKEIDYQDGAATVSMNVGEIYKKKKKYDSAIHYFDLSLEVYRGTVDATFPLNYIGEIYADQGNFEEALGYQNKALEIARNLDAKLEITQSLLGIGKTFTKKGDHKLAISYYQQTEKLAREIGAKMQLKDAYSGLAMAYAKTGNYKKAYTYDTMFGSIKDTLYNTANDKKVQQLQFNFDIGKKEAEIDLLTKDQALKEATIQRQRIVNYAAGTTGFLLILVIIGFYNRYKYVRKTNKIIKNERDRSQELLLNILPEETARELEADGVAQTRYYESVTVLFTDFKGFSTIAGQLSPQDLVAELNDYFIAFDEIVEQHNLEKIKTIGDAYMCAGGIPTTNDTHAIDAVRAALAMQDFMQKRIEERNQKGLVAWELRIGIHTGPIVAGVVGKKKYAYDIWGDTVNVASRMESNGAPGKVNVSSATYQEIKEHYECVHRGKVSAKNIGEVDMYFVGEEVKVQLV